MRTLVEALATAAVAIPPSPPMTTSPLAAEQSGRTQEVLYRRRDVTGQVWVCEVAILLGWECSRVEIAVPATEHTLSISQDHHGDLIRTVVLEPGKPYYGNGRPREAGSHRSRVSRLT